MRPALAAAGGRLAPAVAAMIAITLIAAFACGGGTDAGPVTPAATTPASPEATPTQTAPATLDLAAETAVLAVSAVDAGDFAPGLQSLAHGDFNGDGFQDLLAGAPFADGPDNSREDAGEAYVIFGGAKLAPVISLADGGHALTIYGAAEGDSLGFSVLGADVNGDGIDDVIVGAPGVTAGEDPRTDQGQVYVLLGSRDLGGSLDIASAPQSVTVTGAEGFSRLGHATASGDVNGDGTADLILGAPFAGREPNTPPGGPRTAVGEVYVVLGGASLPHSVSIVTGQQDLTLAGRKPFGQFGVAVAAGDVNADGIDDIIVSAPQADEPDGSRQAAGAVYVFFGAEEMSDKLTVGEEDILVTGLAGGDNLGTPLAAADFNGDGADDLIAGAQRASGGEVGSASGAVVLIFGESDLPESIDLAEPGQALSIFGSGRAQLLPTSLAASDLNGDGAADLVLGSVQAETPQERPQAGLVYVVLGGQNPPDGIIVGQAAHLTIVGAEGDGFLGSAVAGFPLTGEPEIVALAAGTGEGGGSGAGQIYVLRFAPP